LRRNPTKYRILHIIDHLGTGGAQELLCHLIKYGQRGLFQPEVVALHGFGHYWEVLRSWGVPVYTLSPHKAAATAVPLIAARLFHLLKQRCYDVVHGHLMGANILGTSLAAMCRVPVRFIQDNTYEETRYRRFALRWLDTGAHRFAHHTIAVSSSIRNFLCREEKLPAHKISVIYPGIDLALFTPAGDPQVRDNVRTTWDIPKNAVVVGGVGRLHYQKNFPFFLKVAQQVMAQIPQAVFVIAGDGPERAALEELSRKLGIAPRVRFLGFVKELRELYLALDLLLFPSRFEGTPLTVLGALAMEVPVVASRVDGIAELLEDGQDACLLPLDRQDLFVQEVCRLLQDRSLSRRLARSGREKVQRNYSAEAFVGQVEGLYLKCLEEGHVPD
jgi:glycosyltransferase involved in cell wall biosynthesis